MKKLFIIYIFINLCFLSYIKAQSFIVSAKCGFTYATDVDFEIGGLGVVTIENKFNEYLSLGINAKLTGTDYVNDESFYDNNYRIIESKKLSVANSVYSLNIFPKISFITTDELIISLIPEIGFYWNKSHPVIYFTDEINSKVTYQSYKDTYSSSNLALGLFLEGQYYLGERTNIIVSLGWNNYDVGNSLNKIDLEGNWEHKVSEKTNFLYFEVGIAYRLFGKDIWY
ncbi:MAG: hypothetical protein R6U15_07580 [Candidatus Izemoplasmatales bacterium]